MRKFRKGFNLAAMLMLIGVIVCQDGYALRVPMNGRKRVEKALAPNKDVLKDVTYDGAEEERFYYETVIGWVTHILENYNTQFGGNKLIFIGGACKRAWQAAIVLCKQYDVNEKDIVYLDLPRAVHKRTDTQIITQYLKQQGLFDKEEPIAVFDNMVNSEGFNSTFGKVAAAIRNLRLHSEVIHYILDGANVASYSTEVAKGSGDSSMINRTAIFMGASNWMKTDVRREKVILYKRENEEIIPIYLDFQELSRFLSEIKEGDNIFTLNPALLSKELQNILPLVRILITDMGFSRHDDVDWIQAYKQLQGLCESNTLQKADMQDKMFLYLLKQHSSIATKLLPNIRQTDL